MKNIYDEALEFRKKNEVKDFGTEYYGVIGQALRIASAVTEAEKVGDMFVRVDGFQGGQHHTQDQSFRKIFMGDGK